MAGIARRGIPPGADRGEDFLVEPGESAVGQGVVDLSLLRQELFLRPQIETELAKEPGDN
jgi:hypothetical protein